MFQEEKIPYSDTLKHVVFVWFQTEIATSTFKT